MSLLKSLPAQVASRSPKALTLLSLALLSLLLLASRPAKAQYGGWSAVPCDAKGNPISAYTDQYGFYYMSGTQTETAVNTYPLPMIKAVATGNYASLAEAGRPLGISPVIDSGNTFPGGDGIGYTDDAEANNYVPTGYSNTGLYWVPASFGAPSSGPVNGSVTVDVTGQLVFYFKVQWYGMGTAPAPPSSLSLLLRTQVRAGASAATAYTGQSATATATDGPPYNETSTASASNGSTSVGTPMVVGYHLVTASVAPGTGIAEVYLNGQTHTQAVNNVPFTLGSVTNRAAMVWADALVGGGVRQDNRAVSITSPDIETSYQFGPFNTATNTYPPDVRAANGSIITDSAVSPPLTQPGSVNTWRASPTLLGQAPGFQNPVFAWSLTGAGSLSASGNTSHTQLSVSFPLSSTATALNQWSTAQVTVTDSDGAIAANMFTVLWHYPKENASLFASGQPFWQPEDPMSVTATGYKDGNAVGTFGYATYANFFPTAASDIFTVGSNLPASPWSAFVAAVGVAASQVQPVVTSASCNFDQCWKSPFSTGLPNPLDPALMNKYQMSPLLEVQYQEQTWQYQQYGQKGYLGLGQEGFNHFMGSVQDAGAFTKIVAPPPGG